ncbi:uncharacterized protein LOC119154024 [Falco rusticolus]|uniref:uncharacterized protein LOC119154024 n=1 Tax=Falco rusticolus TaxID=120794 RepID=UPI0018867BAE|nr:uncharacterized protein LOC119154024 [Falco rusticolus]
MMSILQCAQQRAPQSLCYTPSTRVQLRDVASGSIRSAKALWATPGHQQQEAGGNCPGDGWFQDKPCSLCWASCPCYQTWEQLGHPWALRGTWMAQQPWGSWSRAWGSWTPETGIHELIPIALLRECLASAGKLRMERGTCGDRGLPPALPLPPLTPALPWGTPECSLQIPAAVCRGLSGCAWLFCNGAVSVAGRGGLWSSLRLQPRHLALQRSSAGLHTSRRLSLAMHGGKVPSVQPSAQSSSAPASTTPMSTGSPTSFTPTLGTPVPGGRKPCSLTASLGSRKTSCSGQPMDPPASSQQWLPRRLPPAPPGPCRGVCGLLPCQQCSV